MGKLAAILVALLFAAPVGSTAVGGLRSGLRGTITTPPGGTCLQDQPCGGPTAGVTIVFSRNGRAVKRVVSDSAGRYRVPLAPGIYAVASPNAKAPRGHVEPARVRVYAGGYRRVSFLVDPGVRPQ